MQYMQQKIYRPLKKLKICKEHFATSPPSSLIKNHKNIVSPYYLEK
jgi:hypothetical protein